MRSTFIVILALITVGALSIATFFWDTPVEQYGALAQENPVLSGLLFISLMFLATVVAPLSTTPIIPVAAGILDPFIVGVLSVLGWTAGAVVAFLLARRYGKPLIGRFMDMSSLERYENLIPARLEFLTLILMRMVIPVDVLSYAIGLVSGITLWRYTLATLIGVTPFSFVFAYSGAALFEGRYLLLVSVLGTGVVLFVLVWAYLRYVLRSETDDGGGEL